MNAQEQQLEEQLNMLKKSLEIYGERGEELYQLQKKLLTATCKGEPLSPEELQKTQLHIAELSQGLAEYAADKVREEYSAQIQEEEQNMNEESEDFEDEEEEQSLGFDALCKAAEKLYPGQESKGFGTMVPYALGGKDPLDYIMIFESDHGGIPHWHYITCGFSDLYEKETDDEECSGYGFELTFRLKKESEEPPVWVCNLLQNLARYVFQTGNVFAPGHHMNANGPIMLDSDTKLTALAFMEDLELKEIQTPFGKVEFIQAVGITSDELDSIMLWNGRKLLDVFNQNIPLGITVMDRSSFMENPNVMEAFKAGMEKDGSSTGFLYTDCVGYAINTSDGIENFGDVPAGACVPEFEGGAVYFGAGQVEKILTMLKGRLMKGRNLDLIGKNAVIQFLASDETDFYIDSVETNDDFILELDMKSLKEILELLKPKAGVYNLTSIPLKFVISETLIKDSDGNVVQRIG